MSHDKSHSAITFYAKTSAGAETVAHMLFGKTLMGAGRRIVTSRFNDPADPGWLIEIRNDIHAPIQAEEIGCAIFVHERASEASVGVKTQAFGSPVGTSELMVVRGDGRSFTARVAERDSVAERGEQERASLAHGAERAASRFRGSARVDVRAVEAQSHANNMRSVIAQCRSTLANWDEGTALVGEVHDALEAALAILESGESILKSGEDRQALAVHTADRLRLEAEQMTSLFGSSLKVFKLTTPQREAARKVLLKIGSWTSSRFDQHLRYEVGDEDADAVLRALNVLGVLPEECDPAGRIREGTTAQRQVEASKPVRKRDGWATDPIRSAAFLRLHGVTDAVFEGRQPGDGEAIVAALAAHWPNAVVHDLASDPILASASSGKLQGDEFFVYRDVESFDSWEQKGATPVNASSLVHIVLGLSSMTVVADRGVLRALPGRIEAQRDTSLRATTVTLLRPRSTPPFEPTKSELDALRAKYSSDHDEEVRKDVFRLLDIATPAVLSAKDAVELAARADGWREAALAERERCAQAIEKAKREIAQTVVPGGITALDRYVHNAATLIRGLPAPSSVCTLPSNTSAPEGK